MKSLLNLALISLFSFSCLTLISCCKPEGHAGKHHHEHSKMHHEHGDK